MHSVALYAAAFKTSGETVDLPGFFSDLVRCETRLYNALNYNALNDRLRERHGIVTSQFEALSYLRDHPGSQVADLAAEFAIGIGATTRSSTASRGRAGPSVSRTRRIAGCRCWP